MMSKLLITLLFSFLMFLPGVATAQDGVGAAFIPGGPKVGETSAGVVAAVTEQITSTNNTWIVAISGMLNNATSSILISTGDGAASGTIFSASGEADKFFFINLNFPMFCGTGIVTTVLDSQVVVYYMTEPLRRRLPY